MHISYLQCGSEGSVISTALALGFQRVAEATCTCCRLLVTDHSAKCVPAAAAAAVPALQSLQSR
jgi:hypothetical protein